MINNELRVLGCCEVYATRRRPNARTGRRRVGLARPGEVGARLDAEAARRDPQFVGVRGVDARERDALAAAAGAAVARAVVMVNRVEDRMLEKALGHLRPKDELEFFFF